MWDPSGHTVWRYDARGRVIEEHRYVDGKVYTTYWGYDAMDRVTSMTYPDGEVVTYAYNNQLLLTTMGGYITATGYNAAGQPTSITYGNGDLTEMAYDPQMFLLQSYYVRGVLSLSYQYYPNGDTSRITEGGVATDFTYDALDRLTGASGEYTASYGYDQIGRFQSKTEGGATYTFDYNGPYVDGAPKHAPNRVNGVQYTYDRNGNLTNRSGVDNKYDAENRLVKVSQGSQYVARMAYDGDGRRAKRLDNYGTIHYVGPHYERNVGTGVDTTEVITKLYWVQLGSYRRLIAVSRAGLLYYVHSDHLGGTNILSDVTGNEVGALRYYAFGQTRVQSGTVPTDKKFTGQTLDASSGLYFYGARYYDPALGRFVQPDSVVPQPGNPQSLNRYSYVLNNPLKYTDPTGNYVMFVGGMGTDNDQQRSEETWGFLIERMGLKEGEYGFFDWSKGWAGPEAAAFRPLGEAARSLAEQIASKADIRLIGHSRGGALVMEYLAQVAEGRLPVNNGLVGAYSIDAPLARWESLTPGFSSFVAPRFQLTFDPLPRISDAYANLPGRLAARGLTVDMATFDNPADWPFTTHEPIAGVPRYEWAVGPPGGESLRPVPYWKAAHGLLLTDPRVGAYLGGGYPLGRW